MVGVVGRSRLLIVVALVLMGACSDAEPTPDANARNAASDDCYELGWRKCPEEPYPFSTPLPPVEPTAVDGTYSRTVGDDLAGLSGKCVRCPPYRLQAGTDVLTLDRGRFFLEHDPPGSGGSGHFWVEENRLRLVNDANCVGMEGLYEWNLSGGHLRLEAVDDECPYTRLRQRFLMATEWRAKDDGTAGLAPECQPPTEEAAVTGHWPIPEGCSRHGA